MAPTSTTLTLNPDQKVTLDAPVRSIDVHVGSLIVTATDDPEVVKEGTTYEGADTASLTLYSPSGASIGVTYSDEATGSPAREALEADLRAAESIHERVSGEVEAASAPEQGAKEAVLDAASARVRHATRRLHSFYPPERKKKAERGDTGGATGSYESRTVKELHALAKEKGIEGYSKLTKTKLIKALRK